MSELVPVVVSIRQIKPIKVSTLRAKAERYRDGFMKLFREYEHAYLLNEDGTPMLDGAGRRVSLTAGRFAREMGINKSTFHYWLKGRPEPEMGSHSERNDDEGWDLPGVPQEAVDKMRNAIEHNLRARVALDLMASDLKRYRAKELTEEEWVEVDAIQQEVTRLYGELMVL